MSEVQQAQDREKIPYKTFINDMKDFLKTEGMSRNVVMGLEDKPENLSGVEGVRFLAKICQQADILIDKTYRKKKFPGFKKAVEDLTGKKADDAVFEGINQVFSPWFGEFEKIKPDIQERIDAKEEPLDGYSVDKISQQKITFAFMLLVQEQSPVVSMLPEGLRANAARVASSLGRTREGLQGDQRFKILGWKELGQEHLKKGLVIREVVRTTLAVLASLGLLLYGGNKLVQLEEVTKLWQGVKERAPFLGEAITNNQRDERYQQYESKLNELRQGWNEKVQADNMLEFFDPIPWPDGNDWLAFVEFCGPECLLDESIMPAESKSVIMDLFQVDEVGYRNLQQNPDELSIRMGELYPNQEWLAELFAIEPTDRNSSQESDYERWYEKWQKQSNVGARVSLLGIPMIGGALGRQARLDRRKDFTNSFGRGRGNIKGRFGSTKGFA